MPQALTTWELWAFREKDGSIAGYVFEPAPVDLDAQHDHESYSWTLERSVEAASYEDAMTRKSEYLKLGPYRPIPGRPIPGKD